MTEIQEALQEYKIPNSWWPIPLINTIHRINISLTISWASSCIIEYLSHQQHEYSALIQDRVRRLASTSSFGEIQEMLDEYDSVLRDLKDNCLISYRHLLQAKQFAINGNSVGVRTQIVWALIFLGDTDYARQTSIKFIIDNFTKVISSCAEDPP